MLSIYHVLYDVSQMTVRGTVVILGAARIDRVKHDWPRLSRDVPRHFALHLNWANWQLHCGCVCKHVRGVSV